MNPEKWQAFYERARTNGELIEIVIRSLYADNLPSDAVALDGGANVGYHTLSLARQLSRGQVIAVEANSKTLEVLGRAVQPFPNVKVVYGALQDDSARTGIEFHCSSSHPGRSGVGKLWDLIDQGQVQYEAPTTVPATTIDRLVQENQLNRLDFIKLDLEGGEFPALRGGERTLRELRPLVVTEHGHLAPALNGFGIAEYLEWLRSVDYVPVSPAGVPVEISSPYPFWYIFLVPVEQLGRWPTRIRAALEAHI
jgi:FkbM family methyltransferase